MTNLPPDQIYYVSLEQIKTWRAENSVVVVDVREQNEWDEAHIPGAILLPLSTFNPAAVPEPGDKHLVFHCRSGRRCGLASEKMVEAGYTGQIKRMEGGFLAWSAAGYDKET
ncbi:MAG: rhodanese-like domain-containing protein [Rhodospirillaceae bacterium]|nr:rhodanese-like domain-containing protein [Rhodospirillaceae bacterium]